MKQRDPLVQTLLSFFIPFYILYWSYITAKEIQKIYGFKAPSILLLLAPVLIFLVAMIILIGGIFSGSDQGSAVGGIGFILVFFIGFPLSFILSLLYYYQFGGTVEKVAGPEASRVLTFILFLFIAPAGVFVAQEKLNKNSGPTKPEWLPPKAI